MMTLQYQQIWIYRFGAAPTNPLIATKPSGDDECLDCPYGQLSPKIVISRLLKNENVQMPDWLLPFDEYLLGALQ